ncbi:MAG TPA: hypothetical protein H9950_04940 [Candidatus Bacteroides avicola]|uniref:Uncharacterized protein n=1 Tax=Candidatus Bacteroides avicola TaxID=2838468 RepID=A0A9D2HW62_9BACE|nr:hypothetical protein [Mediterranea sp. An20]MBW9201743.1 hypothetical protein [Bacteroidales bacterium SW292]HJA85526.1 hypothetical protein [Candidatus Bacteroides avicola]
MKQTMQSINRPALRFRCWNRGRYAAFASMGRCVTIGHLHHDVADRALCKQVNTGTVAFITEHEPSDFKEDPYENTRLERESPPGREHHPDGGPVSGRTA